MELQRIARDAREAVSRLAAVDSAQRNEALAAIRCALLSHAGAIGLANAQDLEAAGRDDLDDSVVKRLVLDGTKLESLAAGIDGLIALPDPVGIVSLDRELAPGLELRRISSPIGVLCVIFESRPEAVIQIATLAIKSGNAVILKGGKEALHSNSALVQVIRDALAQVTTAVGSFPVDCVQLVSTREEVAELLKLDTLIDLVIPRGSNKLVRDIKAATRIPVLGHADGVCSIYVDADADPAMAARIAVDSKTQYPAACNAVETLLLHASAVVSVFPHVARSLLLAGVRLHCSVECVEAARSVAASLHREPGGAPELVVVATPADHAREWLSLDLTVQVVTDVRGAIDWINSNGSHHTDCIVTSSAETAKTFVARVDSAGVYHNASTRFADGFRYGFGAEVGISTSRIHARGPVGLEGLMTYKYVLEGHGQVVAQFAGAGGKGAGADGTVMTPAGEQLPALAFTHRDLPRAARF